MGVGSVRQGRAQDLLNRAADQLVESLRVVFPLIQGCRTHVVDRPHDAEAHSQQERCGLRVLEIGEARDDLLEAAQQLALDVRRHEDVVAKWHTQHLDLLVGHQLHLVLVGHSLELDGARIFAAGVEPRPLTFRRVEDQTQFRPTILEDLPHLL